ncbi:MAG TPA: MBL fold metallo-hydrolase [Moraxellaceae bacterium]|nr:MBL fold metallo-hydrolase [Moraxellaceae bacterium]
MSLRVHHINCGTMCPVCARLINGQGKGWREAARMVCHVLLIETPRDGLILVDTGIGSLDVESPSRLGRPFVALTRPVLSWNETALAQVKALGHDVADVRHILLTHLDLDHAGGLPDFPNAQVHVLRPEFDAAMHPDWRSKARYLPSQWSHSPRWVLHDAGGEDWFGFAGLRPLPGVSEDIFLVPLQGHTRGHTGVAVRTDTGWLLHCGDAYFFHGELEATPHMPAGLAVFERLVQTEQRTRLRNLARLRDLNLARGSEISLFCAHDPVEFDRLAR